MHTVLDMKKGPGHLLTRSEVDSKYNTESQAVWLHDVSCLVIEYDVRICGLLDYYTASCDNYLPTFRDNVSVPSVNNYHTTPCNNPEDYRCHQHRGGSLKSMMYVNDKSGVGADNAMTRDALFH